MFFGSSIKSHSSSTLVGKHLSFSWPSVNSRPIGLSASNLRNLLSLSIDWSLSTRLISSYRQSPFRLRDVIFVVCEAPDLQDQRHRAPDPLPERSRYSVTRFIVCFGCGRSYRRTRIALLYGMDITWTSRIGSVKAVGTSLDCDALAQGL